MTSYFPEFNVQRCDESFHPQISFLTALFSPSLFLSCLKMRELSLFSTSLRLVLWPVCQKYVHSTAAQGSIIVCPTDNKVDFGDVTHPFLTTFGVLR